jgi:ankyrin repeat protein
MDAADKSGQTPLHLACAIGCHQDVKYLAETGHANIEAVNEDGHTALMLACICRHVELSQYLVKNLGASVEATDSDGYTALYFAAYSLELTVLFVNHVSYYPLA